MKNWNRKKSYGLTPEQVDIVRKEQGGYCPGCQRDLKTVKECVDHNHATGKVRGLLCDSCNKALGLVGDDIKILFNLMKYLEAENYDN